MINFISCIKNIYSETFPRNFTAIPAIIRIPNGIASSLKSYMELWRGGLLPTPSRMNVPGIFSRKYAKSSPPLIYLTKVYI